MIKALVRTAQDEVIIMPKLRAEEDACRQAGVDSMLNRAATIAVWVNAGNWSFLALHRSEVSEACYATFL